MLSVKWVITIQGPAERHKPTARLFACELGHDSVLVRRAADCQGLDLEGCPF